MHETANSGPGCGLEEIARSVHVHLPSFVGAAVVSPRAVEDDIAAGDGLVEPPLVAHVGDRELDRETGERRATRKRANGGPDLRPALEHEPFGEPRPDEAAGPRDEDAPGAECLRLSYGVPPPTWAYDSGQSQAR